VLVRPSFGSRGEQARDDPRDPAPDRHRGIEQHEHLLRREQRRRQEQHVLVHVDADALGEPKERLHQPLVEERDGEPHVLGLDPEPAVERLELQPQLLAAERPRDLVRHVARRDPQAGTRRAQRHDGACERSTDAAPALVGGFHVPEIERVHVVTWTPVPDHVLGPVLLSAEHRERQPGRVEPQVHRCELETRVLAQEHQPAAGRRRDAGATTPDPPRPRRGRRSTTAWRRGR